MRPCPAGRSCRYRCPHEGQEPSRRTASLGGALEKYETAQSSVGRYLREQQAGGSGTDWQEALRVALSRLVGFRSSAAQLTPRICERGSDTIGPDVFEGVLESEPAPLGGR